jgi:hypothetical protein
VVLSLLCEDADDVLGGETDGVWEVVTATGLVVVGGGDVLGFGVDGFCGVVMVAFVGGCVECSFGVEW